MPQLYGLRPANEDNTPVHATGEMHLETGPSQKFSISLRQGGVFSQYPHVPAGCSVAVTPHFITAMLTVVLP